MAVKQGSLTGANLSLFLVVYVGWSAYSAIPFLTETLGEVGAALFFMGLFVSAGFGATVAMKWSLLIPSAIALSILTVTVPLAYVITTALQNSLPVGSLEASQGEQLQQLVNSGSAALSLDSVTLTVIGAAMVLLAIFMFMRFTTGRYMEAAQA